jgi:uncharacterized protein YqgC (DUF456 family)
MAFLLLVAVLLVSLFLIPLGLPGLWIMLAAALAYDLLTPGAVIGTWTLVAMTSLAVVAEVIEFSLAARYTKKYGGSRRAGWGAILGGIAGAIIGVPVPVIGSVIGAFAGSFVGALVAEYSRVRQADAATRVATGALIGRVLATAVKTGVGLALLVWVAAAAWA